MICERCKKEVQKKMLDKADEALLRYNKKLKKEMRKIKNDTSK